MNDRELLEMAAKAAGFELLPCTCSKGAFKAAHLGRDITHWSPLENDGDAFRLAVKLSFFGSLEDEHAIGAAGFNSSDPYAATRRAIVRAAAEIGIGIKHESVGDLPEDNYYKDMSDAFYGGKE